MYWTLDNRPPTVDEIMQQGAERIRDAVEAAIERHDVPKLEIRCTEINDEPSPSLEESARFDTLMDYAAQQRSQLMGMNQNQYLQKQAAGFGGYNPFKAHDQSRCAFGGIFGGMI